VRQLGQVVVVVTIYEPESQVFTTSESVQEADSSVSRGATGFLSDTSCRLAAVAGVSPVLAKAAVVETTAKKSITTFFMGERGSKVSFGYGTSADGVEPTLWFRAVFGNASTHTGQAVTNLLPFKPGPVRVATRLLLPS